MAVSTEQVISTRSAFRAHLRHDLEQRVDAVIQKVPGGDFANVPIVTEKDLREILNEAFGAELPPPDEHTVEVTTPATIFLTGICPNCGLGDELTLEVDAETLIHANKTRELKPKVKGKAKTHVCGQIPAFPRNGRAGGPGQERARQVAMELEDVPVEGEEPSTDAIPVEGDFAASPEIVANVLSLVLPADDQPPMETIEGWTDEERTAVADWGAAVHLRASDHDDVAIPEKPAVLGGTPEPASPGQAGPDESETDASDDSGLTDLPF